MAKLTKAKRYEIWQARVRFEDEDAVKERPVLIWNHTAYVIAYKMTGTDRGDDKDEYRVVYWQAAGLSKPTSVRITKQLKLIEADLLYQIGILDRRDQLRFALRIVP